MWAILSGVEGNLTAYQAVLADLKRLHSRLKAVYILGDLVGPRPESEALVELVRAGTAGLPQAAVCLGWWEEHCLSLHGLGGNGDPEALIRQHGADTVQTLWKSVPLATAQWLRSLDLGFYERDCMLIHGSTLGVHDCLHPETPAFELLDRLVRADAHRLFCGRSGLIFELVVESARVATTITTLDGPQPVTTLDFVPRQVVGVGNVGRLDGQASYILYDPSTDRVEFKSLTYGTSRGCGRPGKSDL
jgi:hypothetical protein